MNYRIIMRNLREDMDLTQREVGAVINKPRQGYSHIEDGRAELKIDDLIKLCKFYGDLTFNGCKCIIAHRVRVADCFINLLAFRFCGIGFCHCHHAPFVTLGMN